MKDVRCYLAGKVKQYVGEYGESGHRVCSVRWRPGLSERRGLKWELVEGIQGIEFVASDGARDSNHGYLTCEDHAWNCYDLHSVHRPGGKFRSPQAAFSDLSETTTFLLAVVDTPDAFGTIAEIAWCAAKGLESHIIVIGDEYFEDYQRPEGSMRDAYHFVAGLPGVTPHYVRDAAEARKKVWSICGTKSHANYLRSPEWRQKREQALARAARRCQVCNTPKALEVHHRTYENWRNEKPEDLTVLCGACHGKFHE